jgi:hypothetical protein
VRTERYGALSIVSASSSTQITERDLELLRFAAEHRIVLCAHVQTFLGVSAAAAYGRLRSLTSSAYLAQRNVFYRQPGCFQITRKGLATIGSGYSPPRLDLNCYRHDVGTAWLWLAARGGALGPLREILTERRLRSEDATDDPWREPWGVRLAGHGSGGRERLHYPDLLLVMPDRRRVAVELELTAKGRGRRDRILSGYAFDSRIPCVLYLVERPGIGRAVKASAQRAGIPSLVHVQPFRWDAGFGHASHEAAVARRSDRAVQEVGR